MAEPAFIQRIRVGVLLVAALLALTGCRGTAHPETTPATITVRGTITYFDDTIGAANTELEGGRIRKGARCSPRRAAADLAVGTRVTVTDENDRTIGTGALEQGTNMHDTLAICAMPFSVQVPTSGTLYGVHVGNANRPTVEIRKADLGHVELEFG
jgi:hypothetical protein